MGLELRLEVGLKSGDVVVRGLGVAILFINITKSGARKPTLSETATISVINSDAVA